MKIINIILTHCLIAICLSCGEKGLSNDDVKTAFEKDKVYPRVAQAQIFVNEEKTASLIRDTDLEEQGYVTVKLSHSLEDIGQPLVLFTEKSRPFLIAKPDSLESIEKQPVKVADEKFLEVKQIAYSEDGKKAVVDYSVTIDNQSPFIILLASPMQATEFRRTNFIKEGEDWKWTGDIIKISSPQ